MIVITALIVAVSVTIALAFGTFARSAALPDGAAARVTDHHREPRSS